LILKNEAEAALMDQILREDGIPHYMRSYHDRVYDGIWQFQHGWGEIETPVRYANGVRALLTLIRSNAAPPRLW